LCEEGLRIVRIVPADECFNGGDHCVLVVKLSEPIPHDRLCRGAEVPLRHLGAEPSDETAVVKDLV